MKLLYIGAFVAIVWSYICWSLYKAYLEHPIVVPPPPGAASAPASSVPSASINETAGSYSRSAGLDPAALLLLPVFVYSAGNGSGETTTTTTTMVECAVCLAELKDGETGRLLPLCGHVFHRGCIDVWLDAHSTCPICRAAATVDDHDAGAGRSLDLVV